MKECRTTYSYLIEHMQEPSFLKVWDIAFDFVRKLPSDLCDELHESLNRGVDVLDSEPLLQMYIYAFGKMHKAKLQYAFEHMHKNTVKYSEVEIVDYGCGQGLATICYHDYLQEHNIGQKVKRIILIEPSSMALSRAELLCARFFPEAEIIAINKQFDNLAKEDLNLSSEIPTIHLLSNILDVESYDLQHFSQIVKEQSVGDNEYVIVSPIQSTMRIQRLRDFVAIIEKHIYFEKFLDKRQLNSEKEWTCVVFLCSQRDVIEYDCDKVFEEAGKIAENENKVHNEDYYRDIFHKLQVCAKLGDAKCQNLLGIWYNKGIGIEKNYELALEWYKKSSEQEYAKAYSNLGDLYYYGEGVGEDLEKAVEYYTIGANLNSPICMYNLAYCYYSGEGVEKDERKAFDLYKKSAELGYCPAQEELGKIYKRGLMGKKESPKMSFNWYFKAAEQGSDTGEFYMGYFYAKGYGVKKDVNQSFEWYSKAVKHGNPHALNNFAYCYEQGIGTSIDLPKAAYYYEKAAKMGNTTAQKNLAKCYKKGIGVNIDPPMAFLWTLEAAKGTDLESQKYIALYYLKGYGTDRSHKESLMWYARYYLRNIFSDVNQAFNAFVEKAKKNDAHSLYIVGKCLQYGIATDKNITKANSYFEKAANLGHVESLIKLRRKSSLCELCSSQEEKEIIKDPFGVTYSKNKKILISTGYINAEEYKIADGTRIICDNAFYYASINKVIIPPSVLLIGKNPFSGYKDGWGEKYYINNIESHSCNFVVSDYALYTRDMKKLISYFGKDSKFAIPQGVEIIGERAFADRYNLVEVIFPEGLCSIQDEAFIYCTKLRKIDFPVSVTTIGTRCFYGCINLSEVLSLGTIRIIPQETFMGCNITLLTFPNTLVEIENNAFNSNNNLQNVTLPDSVRAIGDCCFAYCGISNISLNSNLQKIGDFCFFTCQIDRIKIPSQVKSIGINPFIGTQHIECIDNERFVSENGLLYGKENGGVIAHYEDSEIALYPPISRVNSFAFYMSKVTDVFMGANVVDLEPWAFYQAEKLERIIWQKSNIEEIPEGCLGKCTNLTKIIIPASVKEIKRGSLFDCYELRKIRFEGKYTKANEKMFERIQRPLSIPKAYESPHHFMGSTISESYGRENIDFSSFTKIEISVPYGCSEMYKFETIYENYPHDEYGSYGYGMDRTFVLSDDGRE